MPMQLADFPRWLRALFAVFLILFFFNALYALAFFTAIWHLRIDPGVATLMGAIVGFGIVAWQARAGFTNLIRSQQHRADIETEVRRHQHTLDVEREARRTDEERRVLLAALRAEITGLMDHAQTAMRPPCTRSWTRWQPRRHEILPSQSGGRHSTRPCTKPAYQKSDYWEHR
jgi:hypothetical protein